MTTYPEGGFTEKKEAELWIAENQPKYEKYGTYFYVREENGRYVIVQELK